MSQAKNPALFSDLGQLSKVSANKIDDYKQIDKDVKSEAWADNGVNAAYMKALGLMEADGSYKEGYEQDAAWQHLTQYPNSTRAKAIVAHQKRSETPEGRAENAALLKAMANPNDKTAVAAGNAARRTVSYQGDQVMYAQEQDFSKPGAGSMNSAVETTGAAGVTGASLLFQNFEQLKAASPSAAGVQVALSGAGMTVTQQNEFAQQITQPITINQAAHINSNAGAYAKETGHSFPEVEQLAKGAAMGIPVPSPEAQGRVVNYAVGQADSANIQDRLAGAAAVANINPKDITGNKDVQKAVADALDGKLDKLEQLYMSSKNDPAVMKKMEGMVKAVSSAAATAAAKATTGSMTDLEKKLAQIGEDLKKNNTLKKIGERKKS